MTMAPPPWRMISFGALACSLTLACTGALALGCVDDAAPAQTPPAPAPFEESVSSPPAPGMLWTPGCWHWDGSGYVWLPGHWDSPPPR